MSDNTKIADIIGHKFSGFIIAFLNNFDNKKTVQTPLHLSGRNKKLLSCF